MIDRIMETYERTRASATTDQIAVVMARRGRRCGSIRFYVEVGSDRVYAPEPRCFEARNGAGELIGRYETYELAREAAYAHVV